MTTSTWTLYEVGGFFHRQRHAAREAVENARGSAGVAARITA
jgi:hypothetical protein